MSMHPNVILLCALTPNDLARKTYRAIVAEHKKQRSYEEDHPDLEIGGTEYHCQVMESDYDEDWQIGSKEGDIIVFDLVTYGYGETISWDKLSAQKDMLEAWAKEACEKFSCSYRIEITANYW